MKYIKSFESYYQSPINKDIYFTFEKFINCKYAKWMGNFNRCTQIN